MVFTDMIMVGRLGKLELAATSLSVDVLFSFLMMPMGILALVAVWVARAEGAGEPDQGVRSSHHFLYLALLLAIPGTLLCYLLPELFAVSGQDDQVVVISATYLHVVAWSVLPTLIFTVIRNYLAALEITRAVSIIMLLSILLNAALNYLLIFGHAGFPRMGVEGSAVATSIISWMMLLLVMLYIAIAVRSRRRTILAWPCAATWQEIFKIVKVGLPAGVSSGFEYGGFVVVAIIMGTFGAETLAANQIVFNFIFIISMVCYGLGDAGHVLMSNAVGRKDMDGARRAGRVTLQVTAAISFCMAALLWLFPNAVTSIFLDTTDAANLEVISLAAAFFFIASFFQFFEAIQAVAARLLRAFMDTLTTMWITLLGYWVVGIMGGMLLVSMSGIGAVGIWITLTSGLLMMAVALMSRYAHTVRAGEAAPLYPR